MKICDIFKFLNSLYPVNTAEDFDNVGLLIGSGEAEVSSCVVTLDCTKSAVKRAIEQGAKLIITHHPVIFEPIKTLPQNSIPSLCIKNGISVISMHTNMDKAEDGVNFALCKRLGLKNVKPFFGYDGFPLLKGDLKEEMSADALAEYLKNALGGNVRYNALENTIKTVALCCGSGGSFLFDAIENGCDALITGDVKHNVFVDAQNEDFPVFDAGHFYTEDVITEPLCDMLRKEFSSLAVIPFHGYKVKTV